MVVPRILVIEDSEEARAGLGCLLVEEGFAVRTAGTGQVGLECALDFEPDAIVCDFDLPDIDGLQVLRRLRAMGRNVFIIVVTAGRYGEGEGRALRSEADAFMDKPIDLDQLRRTLEVLHSSQPRNRSIRALS